MSARQLVFTRDEAFRRLSIAIDDYRGYLGPGQWRVRSVYHESAPFIVLEYIVANDKESPSIAEILAECPELPWQQFGGEEILAVAQMELFPNIEPAQFISADWYTALGYIAVLPEEVRR